jgi:hypothetical protein
MTQRWESSIANAGAALRHTSLSMCLLVSQSPLLDWARSHELLLGLLSAASVPMFVGSISLIPWLVIRIPADYFLRQHHYADQWKPRHPLLRILFLVTKNLIGAVLLVAGIVMLVTPGQGILTILVGLLFLDFPGKFALERRVVRISGVLKAIDWVRSKAGRPPLEVPKEGRGQ